MHKPYCFTILGKTVQQLEILHYATALYINMGYRKIQLSLQSEDMIDIVKDGWFQVQSTPDG